MTITANDKELNSFAKNRLAALKEKTENAAGHDLTILKERIKIYEGILAGGEN